MRTSKQPLTLTTVKEMRALIANEPRTYREALVHALHELRPQVEFSTVESDELERGVERFCPHLVVCSRVCDAAQSGTLTWVILYPEDENRAEVIIAGKRITIAGIRFGDLLSVIDLTEFLCRSLKN